jgi:hypothetical protein
MSALINPDNLAAVAAPGYAAGAAVNVFINSRNLTPAE